jgi:flagellar assembly factor FliW
MEIQTTRFGRVEYAAEDILRFPEGLPGLAECRDWVMLADAENDAVAWMQSVEQPKIALAVVSPRRFVPGFQLRVARKELEPLKLDSPQAGQVLAIVGRNERGLTLNLKAPMVINLDRRIGRQVIANGELPLEHALESPPAPLKRTA